MPDEIWEATPLTSKYAILCLGCFTRLADEALLPWDRQIEFWPVSLATHLTPFDPVE